MIDDRSRSSAQGTEACLRLVQAALLLYGLAFIWNTSFVLDGRRFFCLFEDAMVSMRYARNCAAGAGLVWNPGEAPVEGYTNFLWTLLMIPWHWARLDIHFVCLPVQLLGLLCLLLNTEVVFRIAQRVTKGGALATLFSLVCTAFYLPILNWSLLGMETGLMTLVTSLACLSGLDDLHRRRVGPRPYFWLLVATLIRVDALVFLLGTGLLLAALDPPLRRRRVFVALGLTCAIAAAQCGLRLWYYGDPLPNTYYLKMTGLPAWLRLLRGAWVNGAFLAGMAWVVPAALLGFLGFKGMRPALLLGGMFALLLAYSVYVGGDAWEFWGGSNRFVSPAMPLLFVCAGQALALAAQRWTPTFRRHPLSVGLAAGLLTLLVITPQPGVLLLSRKTLYVGANKELVRSGLTIRDITFPAARVAVVSAGVIPYFSGRPCVDLLGKNDRYIARLPMHINPLSPLRERFYPGHSKWDYRWSVGALKPDVIAQVGPNPWELAPFQNDYIQNGTIIIRKGSPNIRWDKLPPL